MGIRLELYSSVEDRDKDIYLDTKSRVIELIEIYKELSKKL